MYFPSKRDAWLGILLWGVVGSGFYFSVQDPDTTMLYVTIPLLLLAGWIWFFTGYTLTEDLLIVRCGPLRKRVALTDIKYIKESRKALASAALSMERLEIHTGHRYPVIISPRDKEEFLQQIQNKNVKIKIEKRKSGKSGKSGQPGKSGKSAHSAHFGKKRPVKQKRRR